MFERADLLKHTSQMSQMTVFRSSKVHKTLQATFPADFPLPKLLFEQ